MKITFEDQIPNIVSGVSQNFSVDTSYNINDNKKRIEVLGEILVIREVVFKNRVTQIRDCIPIHITLDKSNLIKKTDEVILHLEGFKFDFGGEYTKIFVDLELTNVNVPVKESCTSKV